MKILMLLSNPFTHDPRVYNEAKSLIKNGHKVTVFAWDKKNQNKKNEEKNDIQIIRSYNSKFMQILPYDIFRLHTWWRKGYKEAIPLFKDKSYDAIHCHNLDTLPIGIKLKKKLKIKLIYDAHEIWGYMVKKDLPNWWANYYLKKEKKIINNADRIITVNEPLKEYFKKITNKKITIIMNCKKITEKKYKPTKNKKTQLIYIGTLTKSRFLLELVEVVEKIPNIKLIIGGIGSKKEYVQNLKNKCKKSKNTEYIGKVPIDKVIPMTKKSDIVICMTNPEDPNNSIALANKQFEAMTAGRPIITTKNTYPGIFTEKEKCGLTAEYNKDDLKKTITKLTKNPELREKLGKKALKLAVEKYNWQKQEKKLVETYENLYR